MGQVESQSSDTSMEEPSATKPSEESSSPPSMESLMAGIYLYMYIYMCISHSF